MFTVFRRKTAAETTVSSFALYRRANQVAQTQPTLATELRMLAAYGKNKQGKKPQGGSKARSKSPATPSLQKPVRAAEVRVPRIFVSLFEGRRVFA